MNGRLNKTQTDPFLRAVGIDSKEQGGRAELIIVDDLVGETSYRSPQEIERRCNWLRTIGNLLENSNYTSPLGGVILVVENRWSLNDVNSMIHNEMLDWKIWRRSAYKCYVHGYGNCGRWGTDEETECAPTDEPLWQDKYPDASSLEAVRRDKGDEIFAAQWLNDPTVTADLDANKFQPFTIQTLTYQVATGEGVALSPKVTRGWCAVIQGSPGRDDEVIPLESLTAHVISVDPATSKELSAARTALSWLALDRPTGRVFWLDCRADRWSPDEAVEECYKLWCDIRGKLRGAMPKVLVEKVAAQGYFASALKFQALRNGQRMSEPVMIPPAHGFSKDDRIIRRLGGRLNQNLLYLREGLQLPRAEARRFPTGTKDTLDTMVQAEEIFLQIQGQDVRGTSKLRAQRRRRARQRKLIHSTRAGVSI